MENPLFDGEGIEFHHLQRMRQIELQKKTNDLLEAANGGKVKASTVGNSGFSFEGRDFLFLFLWAVIAGGSYLLSIPAEWTETKHWFWQAGGIAWVLQGVGFLCLDYKDGTGWTMLVIAAAVYGFVLYF